MKIINFSLSILLFLSFSYSLLSQNGIQVYGGISDATNKNENVTPSGTSHSGWHLGADARLNEGKMYFMVGMQYHKIQFTAQSDKSYFKNENTYNWTKFRVGLGYNVINFNPNFFLRGHSLLSFNLVNGVPTDNGLGQWGNYNSGVAGANLGLGFDFYNITFDVAYEIGIFNLINMTPGTSMDCLTVSLGYKI